MDESVGSEDDFLGEGPDFKIEASILIGGARGGEEGDVVSLKEFTAVDGGPDSRSKAEKFATIGRRVENLECGDFRSFLGAFGAAF